MCPNEKKVDNQSTNFTNKKDNNLSEIFCSTWVVSAFIYIQFFEKLLTFYVEKFLNAIKIIKNTFEGS
jgi:hypothetical protein